MNSKKFATLDQAKKNARQKIRSGTFKWLEAGAEDNFTTDLNINILNSIKFIPRVLKKNYKLNLSTKFLNTKISSPIILCPMGNQTQFNRKGEIETCKGTYLSNTIGFFSTQGRHSLKNIRKYNKQANLVWQFFLFGDREWVKSQIKSAEINKCKAISICLDAPVRSHRYMDRETFYDARKYGNRSQPLPPDPSKALEYDWEIIKWIKKKTNLPLILKGLVSVSDAILANKYGSDILWVSNHGGRMVNSGISSAEALLNIRRKLGPKVPLIVDGGIRRGSDVAKYLSMGANYVGIGRPAMHGLIIDGGKGVNKIFDILNSELKTFMYNSGCNGLKDLTLKKIILPKNLQ